MLRNLAGFAAVSLLLTGTAMGKVPERPSLKPTTAAANAAADAPPPQTLNTPADPTRPPLTLRPSLPATPAPGPTPPASPALARTPAASSSAALLVSSAMRLAERGQWNELAQLQAEARDPLVRRIILWKRASEGVPGLFFEDFDAALAELDGWPGTDAMRRRAEELIEDSNLSPGQRISWLEASGPRTAAGRVALANAYRAIGQPAKAETLIREVWRGQSLPRDLERTVLARYGGQLSQDDHRARVDFLLWTGQRSEADALKPQLTPDWRRLTEARIALAQRARTVDTLVNAVPEHLAEHPGLLYERARWRRSKDMQEAATPLLAQIDGRDVPSAGRGRLWDERAIAVREDLKLRNYARAYRLAAPHGMSTGTDFAEAEFLAGWISLRLNGDAARSLNHFETLTAGVRAPVSVARGQYWTGRARDALGQADAARAAYSAAAQYKFTYYGQLAADRIGDRVLDLGPAPEASLAELEAFNSRPVIQALRLLAEAGEKKDVREFATHLGATLTSPVELELLAAIARAEDLPEIGVRIGKAGLQRGIVAPGAAYPVLLYPLSRKPQVEEAYILAITRQESEFNPRAISRVGARGLMQFMPATARAEARLRGLPYEHTWLTEDPAYNMTLGGLHLDTLIDQFGGSYIMTAAAYNAGPSRPSQWVRDYGDPRMGQIDPIDWVEFIPFSETRNYVQRVMENIQVYRHRLVGAPAEIRIGEDLKRGRR